MIAEANLPSGFTTSDTSLAAYLYTEGFEILDIDYSEPRRAKFIFKNDNPKIHDLQRLYFTGKAQVDPFTYSRVHKRLSSIVRDQIPWTEGVING